MIYEIINPTLSAGLFIYRDNNLSNRVALIQAMNIPQLRCSFFYSLHCYQNFARNRAILSNTFLPKYRQ